jgi:hydroxyacylglutathione hydrolase
MPDHEILKDLFFIRRGYLNGNHFVYRSKSPVLIDTGYVSGFDETERRVTDLGVNLSDISLIINTHTHCDHIGGNKIIQERSGCDIALHRIGKYFIDTGNSWATWSGYFDQEADFFHCTRGLADGETVSVGPYTFEVIYTPGHAADGIVLYNHENRLLLSSDTLWENDMALINIRVEGSTALFRMQESLERLEKLDVNRVYPGHGKPFSDMKGAIKRGKDRIERFLRHPEKTGEDLIKKIIVYTLMMKATVKESGFLPYLMETHWFKETVDFYFSSDYESTYSDIMNPFIQKGIVIRKNGRLSTSVKP